MRAPTDPGSEALPAHQRLFDEGAMYRRRIAVPPEAALVHRILAPVAEDLNGRVYDDDGRRLIEWLERFWPHDIAGHGRSDGFRWSVIGSTNDAHVLVLITQSLLGARSQFDLDVIVAPRAEQPGAAAGVRLSEKGELASLDSGAVRGLIQAGIAAIGKGAAHPLARAGGGASTRTRPKLRWTTGLGYLLTAFLAAGLFLDQAPVAAAIGAVIILAAIALRLGAKRRRRTPAAAAIDDRIALLEEGRDIRDYSWGGG